MKVVQPLVSSLEKRIASNHLLANLYHYPYRRVVEKEIRLAGITHRDRVINVGCGAVPFSAIYLAILSGAGVVAVDRDECAVEKARLYIKRMNLQHRIQVLQGDGGEVHVPPGSFSAALVALQAEPKEAILENLFSYGSEGSRFVFRGARKFLQSHYDSLPKDLRPVKRIGHARKSFESVLFVKKGEAYAN